MKGIRNRVCKTNEVMEKLSALKPRYTVLCPERLLFDVANGTWFVETIRASGLMFRINRPDTRPHLTNDQSQKGLAKREPSTQDKATKLRFLNYSNYD